MRSLGKALAFLVLFSSIALAGESARSLHAKAVKAEARQDYEAAYEYYKAAYQLKPEDLKYRIPYERSRVQAAASKVHRGQKLREQGDLKGALDLFLQAAQIDPTNDLAMQEARRTQQMMQAKPAEGKPVAAQPEEDAIRRRANAALPPVELNQISDVPLTIKTVEEVRVIYETLGKLAKVNVLFDPEFASKRIPIDLQEVTLQQALDVVALESRTFWRPVTPNTIFVANDTAQKRAELEQNVIKTFYLSNVAAPTDLQDIVTAIRTIIGVNVKLQQIPSQNAIIMRGSPDQLALAQKMIDDIDKAKPEVIVDVVVAQVRRDKVRNIGITPPLNASVSLGPSTVAAPASGSTSSTPGSTFSIKDLEHLKEQNFSFTVDPAKAILSFSDDNGKILQSPRIRAADNEKASLKIQDRLPIATGSFGLPTGIAGATGVGVNTSFSYLDVGITVEITPHVHNNNEVTLKTHLEVSNKTNDVTIGGVQQPQVSTRGIDDQFRLKDGEASLLGGILETSEVVGSSGTPFLGSIPILKYFFSSEKKEKIDNELVILFIPHIVRGQELSDLNRKAIDIGPSTGVSLRMLGKGPSNGNGNTSAAAKPPTNSPATAAPAVPSQPSPPASTPAPVTGLPADGPLSLRLDPGSLSPAVGSTFALNVMLTNGQDISSVPVEIAYDTQLLQFMDVTNGGFLSKDGQSVVVVHRVDTEKGIVRVVAQRPQGSPGISGEGNVLSLMFIAKARGQATVSIAKPGALNSQNQQVQAQTSGPQAAIRVN